MELLRLAHGGDKPGNEIQTPMAIVILFGLLSATAFTMLVLRALYLRFGRAAGHSADGEAFGPALAASGQRMQADKSDYDVGR